MTLNAQKSAEVIVPERGRTESTGGFSTTGKGGRGEWTQKTSKMKAACIGIARNVKSMLERVAHSDVHGRKGTVNSRKERLVHWGFYDLATAYQSVHVNC